MGKDELLQKKKRKKKKKYPLKAKAQNIWGDIPETFSCSSFAGTQR